MRIALIDDQLLGAVLRGRPPRGLRSQELCTTGYWYVRLCQAVLAVPQRTGALSRPFAELPHHLREQAVGAVLELPPEIGLLSLRQLGPTVAQLRQRHQLNILGIEALAAATRLRASVHLSTQSPLLERALRDESIRCKVHAPRS